MRKFEEAAIRRATYMPEVWGKPPSVERHVGTLRNNNVPPSGRQIFLLDVSWGVCYYNTDRQSVYKERG